MRPAKVSLESLEKRPMSSRLEANLLRSGGAGHMPALVTEKRAPFGSFSGVLPSLTPEVMTFQSCRGEVGFGYMMGDWWIRCFRIKIKGMEWKFAPGEQQVNDWMDDFLQNR